MATLRFAMSGADFRTLFQLDTWNELATVESVVGAMVRRIEWLPLPAG